MVYLRNYTVFRPLFGEIRKCARTVMSYGWCGQVFMSGPKEPPEALYAQPLN
jgi:hypothetical protein